MYRKTTLFLIVFVLYLLSTNDAVAAPSLIPVNSNDIILQTSEENFTLTSAATSKWQGQYYITERVADFRLPAYFIADVYRYSGQNFSQRPKTKLYKFSPSLAYSYISSLSSKINVDSEEPILQVEGKKVTEFRPPRIGQKLDAFNSTLNLINALENGQKVVSLSVPRVGSTSSLSSTNDLGINELLARGESNFSGSPKNRRHNIRIGFEKFKGVIIAPGEEFSFNKYLGPVEADQGFLPELVIKGDQGTIPELGGGLCQVSSTTFRAAMLAGLPITQRKNHSYAVKYYAPQGTDATIYPGVIDLKFINDTPGSILIWPYLRDPDNLAFDFYGTRDNRQVELDPPVQYDRKADGSLKASWTRRVIKDGATDSKTFRSVYLPPALFHREEIFPVAPPATSNPPPTPTEPPTNTPPTNSNTNQ